MPTAHDAARQLAAETAHELLRALAGRGIVVTACVQHCATDETIGARALVLLAPAERWTLSDDERARLLAQLERLASSSPVVTSRGASGTSQGLSGLDQAIVELLQRAGPLKGLVVARRLGRGYPYVRKRLALLVHAGVLCNVHGEGYAVTSQ